MLLDNTSEKKMQDAPDFYPTERLHEISVSIRALIEELPVQRYRLQKRIDNKNELAKYTYDELKKSFDILTDRIDSSILPLHEIEESELAVYASTLMSSVQKFNPMTPDYEKLCRILNDFLRRIPTGNETTNARVIGRLMNKVKMGYYPTDLEHISHISRAMDFPTNLKVNVLDPCCGCGLALSSLTESQNCKLFGIEIDNGRANEAMTRLDRVGFGSFFHSSISNEAFHMIFLNPPYLPVLQSGFSKRSEKNFLADSLRYLMDDGVLIYIIPHYRLSKDICDVLAGYFNNISLWKFYGPEFEKFYQVAFIGKKKKYSENNQKSIELYHSAHEIDKLPMLNEIPDKLYSLPNAEKAVSLFKGSEFNIVELQEQLQKSDSYQKLFSKSQLDERAKNPLLPLSIGHIGLLGGSGLINGLIECDNPHILKGRVVKVDNKVSDAKKVKIGDQHGIETKITRTNKMIFNILTPEGFKSLN